jgi:hypothetical protein
MKLVPLAIVGSLALGLSQPAVAAHSVTTIDTNSRAEHLNSWDEFEQWVNDLCIVVGCVWIRSADQQSVEALAWDVINSYTQNGVRSTATSAQRVAAQSACEEILGWIDANPGVLDENLEVTLMSTVNKILEDL